MTRSIYAYPLTLPSTASLATLTAHTRRFRFFFAMILLITGLATTGCGMLDSNAPQGDDYVGPPDAVFYSTSALNQNHGYVGPPDTATTQDDDYVGPPDTATSQDDDYVGPPDTD